MVSLYAPLTHPTCDWLLQARLLQNVFGAIRQGSEEVPNLPQELEAEPDP
jgi:hypothetical protein